MYLKKKRFEAESENCLIWSFGCDGRCCEGGYDHVLISF